MQKEASKKIGMIGWTVMDSAKKKMYVRFTLNSHRSRVTISKQKKKRLLVKGTSGERRQGILPMLNRWMAFNPLCIGSKHTKFLFFICYECCKGKKSWIEIVQSFRLNLPCKPFYTSLNIRWTWLWAKYVFMARVCGCVCMCLLHMLLLIENIVAASIASTNISFIFKPLQQRANIM